MTRLPPKDKPTLLPCGCCSGTDLVVNGCQLERGQSWSVQCACGHRSPFKGGSEEAIAAWNTRTSDTQQSSDMVERVSAIISRVVYQHEPIEAAAREILKACHHEEIVKAFTAIRDGHLIGSPLDKSAWETMARSQRQTARDTLAKIGGDV